MKRQMNLRIEEDLYNSLVQEAAARGVSLTSLVVTALEGGPRPSTFRDELALAVLKDCQAVKNRAAYAIDETTIREAYEFADKVLSVRGQ